MYQEDVRRRIRMDKLKILIVEDGQFYMYGNALKDAFLKKGYKNVKLFSWCNVFDNCIDKRMQNKFAAGPMVHRINIQLVKSCAVYKPALVFLYRCRIIYPSTIKKIRTQGAVIFSYNNDNPFSKDFPVYYWRHYRNSVKYSDVTFVYRKSNIRECMKKGAKRVEILRSYYIANNNYPMDVVNKYDVVFLGHYEDDNRTQALLALVSAGIKVGIPKDIWPDLGEWSENVLQLENTHRDYNKILNESKIALVFLSSLNKDTYTRRCFEIPATKTFMLSQYTDDLANMFEPDKEAVYFKTPKELVEKAAYYLEHEEERERIALAGYERLMRDGHEVGNRVQQIIDKYYEVTGKSAGGGYE